MINKMDHAAPVSLLTDPLRDINGSNGIAKEAMRFFKEPYKIEREAKIINFRQPSAIYCTGLKGCINDVALYLSLLYN